MQDGAAPKMSAAAAGQPAHRTVGDGIVRRRLLSRGRAYQGCTVRRSRPGLVRSQERWKKLREVGCSKANRRSEIASYCRARLR